MHVFLGRAMITPRHFDTFCKQFGRQSLCFEYEKTCFPYVFTYANVVTTCSNIWVWVNPENWSVNNWLVFSNRMAPKVTKLFIAGLEFLTHTTRWKLSTVRTVSGVRQEALTNRGWDRRMQWSYALIHFGCLVRRIVVVPNTLNGQ